MSEEKVPKIEAVLTAVLTNKRLPRSNEDPYLVGTFSLLHDNGCVGEIRISVGDAFKLGEVFNVELKFHQMTIEEYQEKKGFRFAPDVSEIKPI